MIWSLGNAPVVVLVGTSTYPSRDLTIAVVQDDGCVLLREQTVGTDVVELALLRYHLTFFRAEAFAA